MLRLLSSGAVPTAKTFDIALKERSRWVNACTYCKGSWPPNVSIALWETSLKHPLSSNTSKIDTNKFCMKNYLLPLFYNKTRLGFFRVFPVIAPFPKLRRLVGTTIRGDEKRPIFPSYATTYSSYYLNPY